MDPISALIGGGASIIGGILSQNASAAAADKQMQFQQMMSSTAYQRSSADMKAAGLNPMMMFGGGSAASTPAGAMPQTGQIGAGVSNAVNSALNANILQKTIDKLTEEISRTKAETGLKVAETASEVKRPAFIGAQTTTEGQKAPLATAQIYNTIAETYLKRGQFNQADLQSLQARYGKEFFDTPAGKLLYEAGLTGKGVSDVAKPATDVLGVGHSAKRVWQQDYRFP